jgi:ABC-type arginine/histidine transport system permease subunit
VLVSCALDTSAQPVTLIKDIAKIKQRIFLNIFKPSQVFLLIMYIYLKELVNDILTTPEISLALAG